MFPFIGAALCASLALGLFISPTLFHLGKGILGLEYAWIETAAVVLFYISISNWMGYRKKKGFGDYFVPGWPALLVLVLGYGFAWIGHFGFEKNKPATFLYPTYSLLGDFKMFYNMITTWKM